jgi:hypothetical protein
LIENLKKIQKLYPQKWLKADESEAVKINLNQPIAMNTSELSKYPVEQGSLLQVQLL